MMTLILLLSAVCCRVAAGPLGHLTEPSTRPAFKVEQLNIVRMLQDACIAALHSNRATNRATVYVCPSGWLVVVTAASVPVFCL